MADIKITDLAAYTDPVSTDVLPIVDVGNDLTKKVSIADLLENAGTGSAAAPSFSFDGDSDTGIYRPGANQVALTAGGTQALLAESTGITIPGNLTVSGTTTTVDTVNLTVKDKNIELGVVSTPSNTTADGGGITLKGATDKTINWVNSTGAWTFNQPTNFNDHVRIDSSGRLLVGTSSAANNYRVTVTSYTPQVQLVSTAVFGLAVNRTNGDANISIANSSTVANNDTVGRIVFNANDGANLHAAAHVTAQVDGTPGTNDMPGRLVFSTTADGASSPTERLRIDSSGRVGIGTSSPNVLLDVVGTSGSSSVAEFSYTGGNSVYLKLANASNALGFIGYETQDLTFYSNNTERLRIDSSGNVGIGTSSPLATAGFTGVTVSGSTGGIYWLAKAGAQKGYLYGQDNDVTLASTDASGVIRLLTGGNNERLRIDSSGNVGIGTSSPQSKLSVGNGASTDSGLSITFTGDNSTLAKFFANTATGEVTIGGVASNYFPTFYSSGSERMRIDSSGRLLVGTSSVLSTDSGHIIQASDAVGAKLSLGRDDSSVSSGNAIGKIMFSGNAGGTYQPVAEIACDADGDHANNDKPGRLVFSTTADGASGPTERLRIDSSGQVKINQTSADRILKIISTGTNPANMLFQTSSSGTGDSDGLYAGIDNNSVAYFWNFENTSSVFGTNATERMRIASSGNVGIGTTSPGSILSIQSADPTLRVTDSSGTNSNLQAQILFQAGIGGSAVGLIGYTANDDVLRVKTTGAKPIAFDTNNTERLRIDSSGNVKIPAGNFDLRVGDDIDANAGAQTISVGSVSSGSGGFQCFASPTNGQSYLQFGDGSAAASQYRGYVGYKHADDALVVGTAATERMRIDSSGNVVIGATTTEAQNQSILTVNDQGSTAGYVSFENRQNFGWGVGIKLRMPVVNSGAVVNSGKIYSGWEGSDKSYMQFSTYNGSEFERLRIDSSGNVDIGSVVSGGYVTGALIQSGGKIASYVSNSTAGSDQRIYVYNGSTSAYTASIHADGSASFAGALNVGNTFDTGSGVQAFGGGSLYIRQDGSGSANNLLTILNGGSAAANQVARINGDGSASLAGNVGIGTTITSWFSGVDKVVVRNSSNTGSSSCVLALQDAGGQYPFVAWNAAASGSSTRGLILFRAGGAGTIVGSITTNGSSTAYATTSDYRLKENVVDIADGITRIKQLQPKRFNFIADADATVDGFLAHEAQTVVPEAVTGEKDATKEEEYVVTPAVLDGDGEQVTPAVMGTRTVPDHQGIDQSKLVPLLTAALQEAIAKIETLEQRLSDAGIA